MQQAAGSAQSGSGPQRHRGAPLKYSLSVCRLIEEDLRSNQLLERVVMSANGQLSIVQQSINSNPKVAAMVLRRTRTAGGGMSDEDISAAAERLEYCIKELGEAELFRCARLLASATSLRQLLAPTRAPSHAHSVADADSAVACNPAGASLGGRWSAVATRSPGAWLSLTRLATCMRAVVLP
jgi:hypothetical protein